MSHQVGGLLDLPHGVINGVPLPHGAVQRRSRSGAVRHHRRLPRDRRPAGAPSWNRRWRWPIGCRIWRSGVLAHAEQCARGRAGAGVNNAMADACITTNLRAADEYQAFVPAAL